MAEQETDQQQRLKQFTDELNEFAANELAELRKDPVGRQLPTEKLLGILDKYKNRNYSFQEPEHTSSENAPQDSAEDIQEVGEGAPVANANANAGTSGQQKPTTLEEITHEPAMDLAHDLFQHNTSLTELLGGEGVSDVADLEKIRELYAPAGLKQHYAELAKTFEKYAPNGLDDYKAAVERSKRIVAQSEHMDAFVDVMMRLAPDERKLAVATLARDLAEGQDYAEAAPKEVARRITEAAHLPSALLAELQSIRYVDTGDATLLRSIHEADFHLRLKVAIARVESLHAVAEMMREDD